MSTVEFCQRKMRNCISLRMSTSLLGVLLFQFYPFCPHLNSWGMWVLKIVGFTYYLESKIQSGSASVSISGLGGWVPQAVWQSWQSLGNLAPWCVHHGSGVVLRLQCVDVVFIWGASGLCPSILNQWSPANHKLILLCPPVQHLCPGMWELPIVQGPHIPGGVLPLQPLEMPHSVLTSSE